MMVMPMCVTAVLMRVWRTRERHRHAPMHYRRFVPVIPPNPVRRPILVIENLSPYRATFARHRVRRGLSVNDAATSPA